MATRKQKHWVGRGPVISVRVEPELAERCYVHGLFGHGVQ